MNNDLLGAEWGAALNPPIGIKRVQALYAEKRIEGAYIRGGVIWVPKNAPDPRRPHGKAGHEDYFKKQQRKKRREENAGAAEA